MATIVPPGSDDLATQEALKNHIIRSQQGGVYRGARTTLSMTGTRQYNVTAYSLSDIMQGTMAVRGPEETNLVINKALSNNLDYLYGSDYASISAFSTQKYEFNPGEGAAGGAGVEGFGSGLASSWVGDENTALEGKHVAQIAYQSGFRDDPLWMLVAISGRESGWRPMAKNPSTSDRGLWQINGYHTKSLIDAGLITSEETREQELFDPVINGRCAWWLCGGRGPGETGNNLGQIDHHWGANESGWVGVDGDPLYKTDPAKAKAAVAQAQSEGLLGKPFMPVAGSGGGVGGLGFGGNTQHSIAEIKRASQKVGNHPNNWLVKEGGFASGARKLFSEGVSPGRFDNGKPPPPGQPYDYPLYKENGRAWLFPSLLNYMWFIFNNGFILSNYLGAIGMKTSGGGSGPSYHCYGGAIDIGSIGVASQGRTYGVSAGNANARAVGDKLFNILASVPKDVWADEHGCDWVTSYGSQGFRTHKDPGHIHLGFGPSRPGTLLPDLLK